MPRPYPCITLTMRLPCACGVNSWGELRVSSPGFGTCVTHPITTDSSTRARRVVRQHQPRALACTSCSRTFVKKDEDKLQEVPSLSSLPYCSSTFCCPLSINIDRPASLQHGTPLGQPTKTRPESVQCPRALLPRTRLGHIWLHSVDYRHHTR